MWRLTVIGLFLLILLFVVAAFSAIILGEPVAMIATLPNLLNSIGSIINATGALITQTFPYIALIVIVWYRKDIRKRFPVAFARFASYVKEIRIGQVALELRDKVQAIDDAEKDASWYQYNYSRALSLLGARTGDLITTESRRRGSTLNEKAPIEIGMNSFAESKILAQIIYYILKAAKLPVNRPIIQAPSFPMLLNMRFGKVDVYVEYSGIGFALAGMDSKSSSIDAEIGRLRTRYDKWGLYWLEKIGFQNKYEFIVQEDTFTKKRIRTVGDMIARSKELIFAAERDFFIDESMFTRLQNEAEQAGLQLSFKDIVYPRANRYDGLLRNDFDVGVGWSTDPEMTDQRIMTLDEKINDRLTFSPIEQWAIPLCRKDLSKNLDGPLKILEDKINLDKMRDLISQARAEGYVRSAIDRVARDFCQTDLSLSLEG